MGYARTDERTHARTQAIFLFNGFGLSFAPLRAGQKKAQNENQKKKDAASLIIWAMLQSWHVSEFSNR